MTPLSPDTPAAVEMANVSKSFPGVQALDGVTFGVRKGEVHALLGENGAGKSTLMKILAGAQPADAGEIRLEGEPVRIHSPQDAQQLGISVIYQEFNLVPALSVAENIFLGREPTGPLGVMRWRQLYGDADALLERVGVSMDVRAPVDRLSVAHQQVVEIAKALSMAATVLVMDEPSSALTEHELENLFVLIRGLKAEGVSIVYISHRLEEIFEIADRVTVLRDGQHVRTADVSEVTRGDLIRWMVGREVDESSQLTGTGPGEERLVVEGIRVPGKLHDVSFSVRRGEVVGLTGLVGAGRTELARAIFGADPTHEGRVLLDGEEVHLRSPKDAVRLGVGLVPEDRKLQGLVLGMNVRENSTLSSLRSLCTLGFVRGRQERAHTSGQVEALSIRTPTIEQLVRNLSGGNQQKVVLAKWLLSNCRVLMFDEPTRGVDVGAKAEIHQLIRELANRGVAILMISSELPEVLNVSDRILVMHDGRIVGALGREEATQEGIMHLATGGKGEADRIRDPVRLDLPHRRSRRHLVTQRHQRQRLLDPCRQQHPSRLDATDLGGRQVRHDDDLLADERIRGELLGDSGDELAFLGTEVDDQLQ